MECDLVVYTKEIVKDLKIIYKVDFLIPFLKIKL